MTERIAAVVNDNREKAKADCCSRITKYSEELKTAFVNAENKELAFAKLLICSENKASVNSDPSSYKTEQEIEYQAHNRIKDPKFIYAFNEMFKGMTSSKDVETLMSGDPEKITALLTGKDCVYQNHVKVFKSKNIHPADNAASLNTDDHVNKEIHNEMSPYIHS